MALGRRRGAQEPLFVAAGSLPRSPGHPFYEALNELLAGARFDERVEELCEPFYAKTGRRGIPPGTYFRMLLVGYFEGIDSQRGIAWRCRDSLSLRSFLGLALDQETPDHSSLTVIRQRLPEAVFEAVFTLVLELAREKGLLAGRLVGVDSTLLEANAAMKSIVRRDTKEDWKGYVGRLAAEAGVEVKDDADLRRFDKDRKDKTTSNADWTSPSDPDAKISKMKDGTTHLAYKAEHAVDLEAGVVVEARIHAADRSDAATLTETVLRAQLNAASAGCSASIDAVVADRGYHKAETLAELSELELGIRTYVCEPRHATRRRWTGKPGAWRDATVGNRRRLRRGRSRALQRLRSERVERSFAHVCETGRMRRTWIRGLVEVGKRYRVQVAAFNLGVILRKLIGAGTPRGLSALIDAWIRSAAILIRHIAAGRSLEGAEVAEQRLLPAAA